MGTVAVVGEKGKEGGGLLGTEAGDRGLAQDDPETTEELDAARCDHGERLGQER
jgi:hypothetical protein